MLSGFHSVEHIAVTIYAKFDEVSGGGAADYESVVVFVCYLDGIFESVDDISLGYSVFEGALLNSHMSIVFDNIYSCQYELRTNIEVSARLIRGHILDTRIANSDLFRHPD